MGDSECVTRLSDLVTKLMEILEGRSVDGKSDIRLKIDSKDGILKSINRFDVTNPEFDIFKMQSLLEQVLFGYIGSMDVGWIIDGVDILPEVNYVGSCEEPK